MGQERRHFTDEFKREAVALLVSSGRPLSQIASELVYSREKAFPEASPQDLQRVRAGHWAVIDETRRRGIFLAGEPLQPTATATTIRKEDGKPLVLDGPFAETTEQLAGYYILDCNNLDEARSCVEA